jgi:hypothetical protein
MSGTSGDERQGGRRRAAHVLQREPLGGDGRRRRAGRVGDQAEQQMGDADRRVAGGSRGLLSRDHGGAGAVVEAAEALARVEGAGLPPAHEPLLGGLLAHPHAAADVGPRGARPAGLIDEVPDEGVPTGAAPGLT